jgi:hypothetical protein
MTHPRQLTRPRRIADLEGQALDGAEALPT